MGLESASLPNTKMGICRYQHMFWNGPSEVSDLSPQPLGSGVGEVWVAGVRTLGKPLPFSESQALLGCGEEGSEPFAVFLWA